MIDEIFGTDAGKSEFFSNWTEARKFVQKAISENPRLDDATKTKLLQVELQGYTDYSGQWLASEKTEIKEYYEYLQRELPKYTTDEKLLNLFDIAVEGAKETADPNIVYEREDDPPPKTPTWVYGLLGLGVLYILSRR